MFKPGDRVVVTAAKLNGHGKYVGVTGTVVSGRNVRPDPEWIKPGMTCDGGYWHFSSDYFTLELLDDEKSFIPETWS